MNEDKARLDCRICDARAPLDADGLCAVCASFPILVRAFRDGVVRKAEEVRR